MLWVDLALMAIGVWQLTRLIAAAQRHADWVLGLLVVCSTGITLIAVMDLITRL
jgi:hypothetical protein